MTIKEFIEQLQKYDENKQLSFKSSSGMEWKFIQDKETKELRIDEKENKIFVRLK